MSQTAQTAQTVQTARVHRELKALAKDAQDAINDPETPEHVKIFFSGILSGIAGAARVFAGGTADQAGEFMENQIHAAIGKAYLDGTLPGAGTTPETGATSE